MQHTLRTSYWQNGHTFCVHIPLGQQLLSSHPLEQQTQGCPRPSWHRRAAGGVLALLSACGAGGTEEGGSSWPSSTQLAGCSLVVCRQI